MEKVDKGYPKKKVLHYLGARNCFFAMRHVYESYITEDGNINKLDEGILVSRGQDRIGILSNWGFL